ncbi:unnamed protein product [Closterium sp. NIES-54]
MRSRAAPVGSCGGHRYRHPPAHSEAHLPAVHTGRAQHGTAAWRHGHRPLHLQALGVDDGGIHLLCLKARRRHHLPLRHPPPHTPSPSPPSLPGSSSPTPHNSS